MTALGNQRGTALVAALCIAMILLPLGGLVALQSRTDLGIQLNLRNDIETFYVAEAGLAHAVAEIPPGQSFGQLLSGPDRIMGTSDDGVFPFVEGPPPAAFPYRPFRYDVQVAPSGANMLRIVSRASGANGTAKVVELLVTRSPLPFTPSALYAEATNPVVSLGSTFRLSGIDHQAVFPPVPEAQPASLLPALSTPHADAAAALRTALSGATAEQISGAGTPPSVGTVAPLDLGTCADSIANAPAATARSPVPVDDATWGTRDAPQLSIVDGDLRVPGRLTGSGVLIVKGSLQVSGTIEFSGIVLVQGAIVCESASTVTFVGTLWQAASQDARLQLDGNGAFAYSSSALADVDRAFPGLLPHGIVLAGWQEDL